MLQPSQAQKSCPSQDSTPIITTRDFLSKGLLSLTPAPEEQEPILAKKQQTKSNQGEESAAFSVSQEQRDLLDSDHQELQTPAFTAHHCLNPASSDWC